MQGLSFRLKPRQPPVFSGDKKQVLSFVHAMDYAFLAEGGASAEQQVATACTYLDGSARTWLRAMEAQDPQHRRELSTWRRMRKALLDYFSPSQEADMVRSKLEVMRQTKSAAGFVDSFNNELLKLEDGIDKDSAMHLFRKGLKSQVRVSLATRTFKTLAKMQRAAMRVDDALFSEAVQSKRRGEHTSSGLSQIEIDEGRQSESGDESSTASVRSSSSGKSQTATLASLIGKMQLQINALSSKGKSASKRPAGPNPRWPAKKKQQYEARQCFECGQTGHVVRFCPSRASDSTLKE